MPYFFRTDPHDPTFFSKGDDPNNSGKYIIEVKGPDSYEEEDRVSCEITLQPSGGSEVTLASGTIADPFTKTKVAASNLSSGTYTFRAKAVYEDDEQVQGPYGLSVTVP